MNHAEKVSAMRARLLEEPALLRSGLSYQLKTAAHVEAWDVLFNHQHLGFVQRGNNGRWFAMAVRTPWNDDRLDARGMVASTHVQLEGFYATRFEAALCFPSVRVALDRMKYAKYAPRRD